jgi:hypothetical protein
MKQTAGYKCAYCGKAKPQVSIHAHHIYNEGVHRSMSADIDNLISVCFTHHSSTWNAKEPSFHKNPMEMADWFRDTYPERYEKLKERSRITVQLSEQYWENKYKELKNYEKEINK